jgi:hypothetical protein
VSGGDGQENRRRKISASFAEGRYGWFRFAAGHRRIAISLLACTLNSAAAFSIAVFSSWAPTVSSQTALLAILQMFQLVGFGGSGFLQRRSQQRRSPGLQGRPSGSDPHVTTGPGRSLDYTVLYAVRNFQRVPWSECIRKG